MYQHSYTYTVSQHGDYIQHSIDVQSDTYDFFLCVLVMTDRCKIYAPSWSEFSWECFRSISRAYTCSFFKPSRRSQRLYVATCELLPANILVWHILVLASSNACRIVQIESYATIHVYMWHNPRKRVEKKKKLARTGFEPANGGWLPRRHTSGLRPLH
mgnify:FL=1